MLQQCCGSDVIFTGACMKYILVLSAKRNTHVYILVHGASKAIYHEVCKCYINQFINIYKPAEPPVDLKVWLLISSKAL